MRIILCLVLLSFSIASKTQTITFTKVSYAFWDTANINNTWWLNLTQSMTATIDTTKGQVIVPNLQIWANVSSRRNLITGQTIASGDTTLNAIGTVIIRFVGRPIKYNIETGVYYVETVDRIQILWYDGYLAITYPKWNGFNRLVEFTNQ